MKEMSLEMLARAALEQNKDISKAFNKECYKTLTIEEKVKILIPYLRSNIRLRIKDCEIKN
jgi:SMC interacting uncharacterized protein involved in chromosome segregation